MKAILRRLVLVLMVLAAPLGAPAAPADDAGPLAGCPAGAYRFLVTGDSRLRELTIRDGSATLVPGCRATKAQLTVEERGSVVVAEWPACDGFQGRVKLEGRIHGPFCERFDGTLEVGKSEPRGVHADLVGCRVQYPNEQERKRTVDRAVNACLAELRGDPWKDAQDFGRLYYAVQAKLGCALDD
jgi:hypothetical protein